MGSPVTVLVFGTFDGIHDGHRFFLSQAKALGDRLVVAVARDATVAALKHKRPRLDENGRVESVRGSALADDVRLGDSDLGSYYVVQNVKPDIIALGHDQDALESDLKRWLSKQTFGIRLERISRYE